MKSKLLLFATLLLSFAINAKGGGINIPQIKWNVNERCDVNGDNAVNEADVTTLTASSLNDSAYAYWNDVNYDKTVNMSDVAMTINAILGIERKKAATYSLTLPVVYINTQNRKNIAVKSEEIPATFYLDAMGVEGVESVGSAEKPLTLLIKGRGNSTWTEFTKKPYKLKFDKKTELMGMKKNKHFVLMAHADDGSGFCRDDLAFEVSRLLGMEFTTAHKPVEVVLNGTYIGLYYLTEHIRVDENRVNITEQNDLETDPEKVTGGWLIELDWGREENSFFVTGDGYRMCITPKTPEVLSNEQLNYIVDFLKKTYDSILSTDESSTEWEKYLDLDQFVKYYMVNEIMDNTECFTGSCWMSKDIGETAKLKFGPVWDFGRSFAREFEVVPVYNNHFLYDSIPESCSDRWIKDIKKFTRFNNRLHELWKEFYTNGYPKLLAFAEQHVALIEEAYKCDSERWPEHAVPDLHARSNYFLNDLRSKVEWLNEQWGDGGTASKPNP